MSAHSFGFLVAPMFAFLDGVDPWIFAFSFVTVVVTIGMGFWSARRSKTASDFFCRGALGVGRLERLGDFRRIPFSGFVHGRGGHGDVERL